MQSLLISKRSGENPLEKEKIQIMFCLISCKATCCLININFVWVHTPILLYLTKFKVLFFSNSKFYFEYFLFLRLLQILAFWWSLETSSVWTAVQTLWDDYSRLFFFNSKNKIRDRVEFMRVFKNEISLSSIKRWGGRPVSFPATRILKYLCFP